MGKKFEKPTVGDISNYLEHEKNYDFFTAQGFADKFWHYYESKGWKVGKTPMKDWKAAIRTWELNNKKYEENRGNIGGNPNNNGKKLGTSDARIEALKNW